jgi:hypothetical protein
MFTQYKLDRMDVSRAAIEAATALAQSNPGANPPLYAAGVIAARLKGSPAAYLQFGPYWWAVKRALNSLGFAFGPAADELIRAEYTGGLAVFSDLVAGEMFRDFYLANFLDGSAQFWLDDQAEQSYVLFDQDMEARRLGQVSIGDTYPEEGEDGQEGQGADGAVLDAVASPIADGATRTPFAVKLAVFGELWTAEVFADDRTQAEQRAKMLQDSGRIGRAMDIAKGIGQAMALDNTDYDQGLFVDLIGRRVCEV